MAFWTVNMVLPGGLSGRTRQTLADGELLDLWSDIEQPEPARVTIEAPGITVLAGGIPN
jgi:hypothetical protein